MCGDVIALANDIVAGEPLLRPVMPGACRLAMRPSLDEIRGRAKRTLAALPELLRRLDQSEVYPATISDSPIELAREADERNAAGCKSP